MPSEADEPCLVPAFTSERHEGHRCLGKCIGRLHGLCGEADPDCDKEVNVYEIEDRDGDTMRRASDALLPALRGIFVALRFSGESGRGVFQRRCLLLTTAVEGQNVVRQTKGIRLASATVRDLRQFCER